MISPDCVTSMMFARLDSATKNERCTRSQIWQKTLENAGLREILQQTEKFPGLKGMEFQANDSKCTANTETPAAGLHDVAVVLHSSFFTWHANSPARLLTKWQEIYGAARHPKGDDAFLHNCVAAESLLGSGSVGNSSALTAVMDAHSCARMRLDTSEWDVRKVTLLYPEKDTMEVWVRDIEIDKSELKKFISILRSGFEVGKQRSLKVFLNGNNIYTTCKISSNGEG